LILVAIGKGDKKRGHGWTLETDGVTPARYAVIFDLLREYRAGRLPRQGGYLDQPLKLMVQLQTLDYIGLLWNEAYKPGASWREYSKLDLDLLGWLNK
jgi:hypothetical protein